MTLAHRAKLRPLLQAVPRQQQPQYRGVQKLPPEVVGVILTFLTTPDQVCFSLSCKYLFACFHSFLQAQGLKLAQLLPPEKRQKLCPNVGKRPRIQLLRRLENGRWKYCGACWSLHPYSAWQDPRWTWRFHRKPCCSKCQSLHGQNNCMAYAGEVEICPCLTISFRDKLALMEACKNASKQVRDGRQYYFNNALYYQGSIKPPNRLWHDCTFTDHPFMKVEVQTSFWYNEEFQTLCVGTFCRFKEKSPETLASGMKTSSMCPHKDTRKWLREFFDEAVSSFSGWHNGNLSFPDPNSKVVWEDSDNGNEPRSFDLSVGRNLGNSEWPNKMWKLHRRK